MTARRGRCTHAGLVALCLLARLHHIGADAAALAHQLGIPPSREPSTEELLLAAKHLGLKAKLSRSQPDRLSLVPLPALALLRDGRVVVLAQCDGQRVLFQDPAAPRGRPAHHRAAFGLRAAVVRGLILVTTRASRADELAKVDFSWLIPSLIK